MLIRIHAGHLGKDKCKALARTTLYWPGMGRDTYNVASGGSMWNMQRYHRKQQQEPLLPYRVTKRTWQKFGADRPIFTLYDKEYLLVVDNLSKFPEICHLESKTAPSIVVKTLLARNNARYGVPDELVADNMCFNSRAMEMFAVVLNFTVTTPTLTTHRPMVVGHITIFVRQTFHQ